jgi:hypothetical protein
MLHHAEIMRLTERSKKSRNARRRIKQKADAEKKAAEWLFTGTEPDFGADDEKPKVRLPLRPAEKQP